MADQRVASTDRVAVIGAGATGCAIARALAPDHDVVVLEKGQVAGEATGLSAGLISLTKFCPDWPDLARTANHSFRTFDGTSGFTFHDRPRVGFVGAERAEALRKQADALADAGFPTSFLTPEEVRARYPSFDPAGFAGAIEYRDHGWVDPHEYCAALRAVAEVDGATFRTNTPVSGLLTDGDRVVGVETADGAVEADAVVAATGWRTRSFLDGHLELPLRPFRLQAAILVPEKQLDDAFPMGHVEADGVYFRPTTDGTLLVGDGFGPADAPESDCTGGSADPSFKGSVRRSVTRVLPDLDGARLLDDWMGVVGKAPDNRPTIDAPAEGPDGLVVAHTVGVMCTPAVAEGVRSLVTGEPSPFPMEPFAVDRFTSRSADWDPARLGVYYAGDSG